MLLPVFVCFSCILFTCFFFFFFFLSCFFVFCFYKVSRETWHSCLSSVSLFCSLALFLIFSSVSRLNCSLTSILIALFCTSTVISPVRVGNQEVPSHASDALNSITLTPTPPHAHTHTHIHTHTLTHSPSLSHTHSHTLTHLFCFLQSGQMPQVLLGSPVQSSSLSSGRLAAAGNGCSSVSGSSVRFLPASNRTSGCTGVSLSFLC